MIGFYFTSEFYKWRDEVVLAGACCTVDHWTYGRVLIVPDEVGKVKEWKSLGK